MNVSKKRLQILVPILVLLFTFSIGEAFVPSSFGENAKMSRRKKYSRFQETKKNASAVQQRRSQASQKINPAILVTYIIPDSAASRSDLKAGDIIISVDNIKPSNTEEFIALFKKIKAGKHSIVVKKSRNRKSRFDEETRHDTIIVYLPPIGTSPRLGIQLRDFRPDAQKHPDNIALNEATLRIDYTPSGSLSQRLDEINVLKSAMVDEETGRVTFIGIYDPTYASGTIPYNDLLADAMQDPYPSFSLDDKPAQPAIRKAKQIIDAEMRRISTDTEYGSKWMTETLMSVIKSKDPIPEKLIFEQRMRQKMGITPEEFRAYLNWNPKSNQTTYTQYRLIGNFIGKLFTSLGIEERFGKALVVFSKAQMEVRSNKTNFSTTQELCNLLGINEELEQIRSDFNTQRINDETAGRRIFSLYYRTLLKGLEASPSEVDRMADRYRDGYTWDEDLAYALEDRYEFLTKEALRLYVFQSFVLSQDTLQAMYQNLPAIYSGVRLYGRPRNSPLMRVMFEADYALKYITSLNPETLSIPGHQSSIEFLASESERLGTPLPDEGQLRYWIKPGVVKMNSFQDKSGVCFVSAEPGIGAEPLYCDLGFFAQSLDVYALGITERYDAYAKLYPSLHIMRETEKIIAFARWIKNNNIEVKISELNPVKNPVPDKVKGFVSLIYISKEHGDMDNMFLDIDGGVDFSQDEGDYWIHEEPSVEATNDVTRQLAASTALAAQAAGAALDGDLETARDLAEKSAQAMTGVIDTTQLPEVPAPVHASPLSEAVSVGTRSVISKEAISAVDRNLQAKVTAQKQITNAESFRETEPEQYKAAVSSARKLEQRSQENLRHLQELLSNYGGTPVYPQKLIVDLQSLDPSKPVTVKPLRAAQTSPPPQKMPSIEKAMPGKEKLLYELSALESDLAMTRATLMRLTRNVQANNMLFKEWQDEATGAIDRAEDRAQELIQDTCSDRFFGLLKWKFKKVPARIKKIEQFEEIIATKDLSGFTQIDKDSWEEIGKAFVSAVQSSPLNAELQAVIKSTQSIIDSSYDITAWFASWRRIQQLEKNSEAYLIAVKKISAHMEKIVIRIKDVKTQLQNNRD